MRVTLSFFVEPSPGRRGWTRKHRYQSHGLLFEVKRPTETTADLLKRISDADRVENYNLITKIQLSLVLSCKHHQILVCCMQVNCFAFQLSHWASMPEVVSKAKCYSSKRMILCSRFLELAINTVCRD